MNNRIKEARKSIGRTQKDFSEMLGLSRTFVNLIESGKESPSDRTIKDICRLCNVNEEWLRSGSGPMFAENRASEEILGFVAQALKTDGTDEMESFKKDFLEMLAELPQEHWHTLKEIVDRLVEKRAKEKDQD